jgi:hypothetical protein
VVARFRWAQMGDIDLDSGENWQIEPLILFAATQRFFEDSRLKIPQCVTKIGSDPVPWESGNDPAVSQCGNASERRAGKPSRGRIPESMPVPRQGSPRAAAVYAEALSPPPSGAATAPKDLPHRTPRESSPAQCQCPLRRSRAASAIQRLLANRRRQSAVGPAGRGAQTIAPPNCTDRIARQR